MIGEPSRGRDDRSSTSSLGCVADSRTVSNPIMVCADDHAGTSIDHNIARGPEPLPIVRPAGLKWTPGPIVTVGCNAAPKRPRSARRGGLPNRGGSHRTSGHRMRKPQGVVPRFDVLTASPS